MLQAVVTEGNLLALKISINPQVMLTGEFEFGNLELHNYTNYVIFVLFVFLITIVLFNLLNALAVSE